MDYAACEEEMREQPTISQPSLKRSGVSSLCLQSLSLSADEHVRSDSLTTYSNLMKPMQGSKQNESTPSLVSTDDESSRAESPVHSSNGLHRSTAGWGSLESRRAYADLTALATASPLLPEMANATDSPRNNEEPPLAPFLHVPSCKDEPTSLDWGQFLQQSSALNPDEYDDDEPMCF